MFKKLWKLVKKFFTPSLQDPKPAIYGGLTTIDKNTQHHVEMRNIELANLRLQKEALEKNLVVTHRTMLITLLAVVISLLLGIYAVRSKQDVKVEVFEQKTLK